MSPLHHAEFMLFIDDRESQLVETDGFLNDGLGADDELYGAVFNFS